MATLSGMGWGWGVIDGTPSGRVKVHERLHCKTGDRGDKSMNSYIVRWGWQRRGGSIITNYYIVR